MTVIVGWHFEGCVYMCGDSAITHNQNISTDITSFGEKTIDEPGNKVEEKCPKIVSLTSKSVVAWSGDEESARSFISTIQKRLLWDMDKGDLLKAVTEGAVAGGTFMKPVRAIFGLIHDGQSQLVAFDSLATPMGKAVPTLDTMVEDIDEPPTLEEWEHEAKKRIVVMGTLPERFS